MKNSTLKKTGLAAVALSSASLFVGCSPQKNADSSFSTIKANNSAIIGGQLSDENFRKANGLVAVITTQVNEKGEAMSAICTGTLIQKNIVLTAAHCFMPSGPKVQMYVQVFFENDITPKFDDKGVRIPRKLSGANVDAVTVNEDYYNNLVARKAPSSDLALARLSKDAPADYQLAKLPKDENFVQVQPKSKLTLAGYGVTEPIVAKEEINPETQQLERFELPVTGDGELRLVNNISVISLDAENKEILLKQGTPKNIKGACHGDSGGPAFLAKEDGTLVQVGVTSRGTERLGNCNEKAIYTDVAAQLSWIESQAAALAKATVPAPAPATP